MREGHHLRPTVWLTVVLVTAVGVGSALNSACSGGGGAGAPSDTANASAAPEFLNLDPAVEFVGRETCEGCHLEQAATYAHTGMGLAFYPMTPEVVEEDFEVDNTFVDEATGLNYRMVERDGRYFQTEYLLDSQGRELVAEEHEMRFVIGSNNHNRSYVTVRNDKLFQAPMCWYPQATRWDFCPGYEHANEHFTRELSQACMHCHNGRMELVEGQRNQFQQPYPHGIGCERCHGPGQLHVERWQSGAYQPTGDADPTIIDPRRLPRQERLEVCFECHLGDAKSTERVNRYGRSVESARPGKLITEFTIPFRFRQKLEQEFGLSAQADRLLMSRCFQESQGRIECLTCHNPHVTVYHEKRPPDFFRQRCLGCHELDACAASEVERQATDPPDDCIACHMRKAEPDDQRFTTFTDHWIRKKIDGPPQHRTDFTLEPMFPDRLAAMPPGEQAFYDARAYFLLEPGSPTAERKRMLERSERSFLEAIEKGFDNVESWFFLGKVQQKLGQAKEAARSYVRAVQHDPAHHDAAYALGQSLLTFQQNQKALDVFEGMLARNPADTMALAELGRASMALGRPTAAIEAYRKAIEVEPWSASLHMNMSKLLVSQQRFDDAVESIRTAARLNPDSAEIWLVYRKVMEVAGRTAEAAEAKLQEEKFRNLPRSDGHGKATAMN